jgi:hypothetical protein
LHVSYSHDGDQVLVRLLRCGDGELTGRQLFLKQTDEMDVGSLESEPAPHDGRREARARLYGAAGEMTDVTDRMVGADAFFGSWRIATDMPHEMTASAWQRCDEKHPSSEGVPAYRVVYKTLRLLPWPGLALQWPNLRVVFANGDVERGGFTTPTAVPGRNPRERVIPEHGRVLAYPAGWGFLQCPDSPSPWPAGRRPCRPSPTSR